MTAAYATLVEKMTGDERRNHRALSHCAQRFIDLCKGSFNIQNHVRMNINTIWKNIYIFVW